VSLAIIIVSFFFFPWALLLIALPGLLAVQLYYREGPGQKISPGAGAGIGLLTGLIGFMIFSVPALPFVLWHLVLHPDPELMQQFRTQMEATVRSNPNPQAQQIMQSLLTPGGMAFICIVAFLFLLIFTLLLSAIGGAIGATLSRRR
jgi:ABC-type multidrug transport system permease subunit